MNRYPAKMNPNRKISKIYGMLIAISIISGIFSSVPVLETPAYLVKLSSIKGQVLIAVFFQCAMAITYTCMAVILYPIIRSYNERAAIGYLGFRMIGSTFLFVGIITLLSLLFISKSFVSAGQPESSYFQVIGELLRVGRDWFNHVGMILPWSLGGLILYYSFFRMNLIPKYLSLWGLIGSILTIVATFLIIFDLIKIVTTTTFILNTPTALFELTLAVFLLIKGFKPYDS